MVYTIKCSECGKIIEFGSKRPEETLDAKDTFPNDAYEFNDKIYCRECVEELIEFGAKDIKGRLDYLEDRMEEVLDALGISKAQH